MGSVANRSIAKNALVVGGASALGAVAGGVTNAILANRLGPVGLGEYAFVLATASAIAVLGGSGVGPLVVRNTAAPRDVDGATRGVVVVAISVTTAMSVVLALGLSSQVGRRLMAQVGHVPESYGLWAGLLVGTTAPALVIAETFRGRMQFGRGAYLGPTLAKLLLLAAIVVAAVAGQILSTENVLALTAVVSAASLGVSVAFGVALLRQLPGGRFRIASAWRFIRESIPFTGTALVLLLVPRVPIWTLGVADEYATAGVYALSFALVSFLLLIHSTASRTLSPYAASEIAAGRGSEIERRLGRFAAVTTLTTLLSLAVGAFLIRRFGAAIFGSEFEDLVGVTVILGLGVVYAAFAGFGGMVLNVSGNQQWTTLAYATELSLVAVFVGTAFSRWGVYGVAIAVSGAGAIRATLLYVFARKRLLISPRANLKLAFGKRTPSSNQ